MIDKNTAMISALKTLLHKGSASTQESMKEALQKAGFEINQSKISRLLRKLGAVKTTNEKNEIVYALPHDPSPLSAKNILAQLIIHIARNETLIVIRTNPGSASLIGRVLDHHSLSLEILGTVAGDDTVFIAPLSVKKIERTLRRIREILEKTD